MSFPRYPKYKESGAEWLGQVPEHWTISSLKRVVEPERKITYGIVQAGPHIPDGVPYIRPTDMTDENGICSYEDIPRTSPEIASDYIRSTIKPGDLVCTIGPSFGKVMCVPEQLNGGNLTQGTARIAVSQLNSARYVFWILRSINSFAQWESSVGGATFRALNLAPLSETMMAIPPLAEQTAIADFLDRETAKIDGLIAEQERLIELLKEKRQAVISHAVTKGLNPEAPMKDSSIEWIGQVPAHWEVVGMTKYLASVVDYRGRTPTKVEEGIFLLTARNIREGKVDYANSEEFIPEAEYENVMRRGKPEIGDVLFTTEAPLGQVANVDRTDVALAQRVIKFRGQTDVLDNYFLKYWLMGHFAQADMEQLATGSTALGIKGSKVVQLRLCLPPYDEQKQIAYFLDVETDRLDTLNAEAQKVIILLQERRSALISAAVTGQIDVREAANPSCT